MVFILGLSALFWGLSRDVSALGIDMIVGLVLAAAALYQLYRILPYTKLWSTDTRQATFTDDPDRHLRILIANVLQTNRDVGKLIDLIEAEDPDLFLTLESNHWWQEYLDKRFAESYPHAVKIPLENLYGMHLYSKIELRDPEITYRIKDDIPGIDAHLFLGNGRRVNLHFVHPMPPSPTEAYASTGRDAELALVGRQVEESTGTAIVAGDLNDVAWSHSTRLFQRISGLLDPRRGRGLFATFHADYWFARWPLDHVFHTPDLALVELKRLPHIGSDHFPILAHFSYEPTAGSEPDDQREGDDEKEADETIERALRGKEDTVRSEVD